ncbi:MAG: hypothetical protein M3036_09285, partial [Bifidobacteriales bacterium]|nr:hypothetical protein [Bifidobacteriales bacterium]
TTDQQVAGSNPVWRTTRKSYSHNGCRAFPLLMEFPQNPILLDIRWINVPPKQKPCRSRPYRDLAEFAAGVYLHQVSGSASMPYSNTYSWPRDSQEGHIQLESSLCIGWMSVATSLDLISELQADPINGAALYGSLNERSRCVEQNGSRPIPCFRHVLFRY